MTDKTLFDKIKEVGTHTIIYGLGSVLQAALGFILIPLYTRYYTTDLYGALALITLCGSFASAIFYLGISSALSRSYYDYEVGYERKRVISTSFYITLLGAFLQIMVGLLLRNQLSLMLFHTTIYSLHIFIALISSAFTFINALFYVLLRFERKSIQVVTINLLQLILSASLILFFLIKLKLGVLAPILGICISQVAAFIALFCLSRDSIVLAFSNYEMKIQLQFGIPQIFIGLACYTLTWIDRLFINKYCSLSDVGIYSLGYKIGSIINILFILAFSQIWAPMRMEYRYARNADELYKLILTYYFAIGLFVTVIISIFSKELLTLISGREDYIIAYRVVPFVMLGYLIYGVVNIIDAGIFFERKVIYNVYIFWFSVLVNVVLNYIFIPKFGYMAAALTTLISYMVTAFLVFFVSNRLYKIHFEGVRLLKVFGYAIFAIILGNINFYNNMYALSVKFFLVLGLMIFFYIFVLNKREKEIIYSFFKWLNPKVFTF